MTNEKIMCSAIWVKEQTRVMVHRPTNIEYGMVFCGYRHCDCLEMMSYQYLKPEVITYGTVQGFLTNNKRFVDRVEARQIAEKQGQLLPSCSKGNELFSEDVWLIND